MRKPSLGLVPALLAAVVSTTWPSAAANAETIVVGAGDRSTTSYQAGRVICRLLNRVAEDVNCTVRATSGAMSNLENVRTGALDLGLVSSRWQHRAVTKSGIFKFMDADYDNLRSLFSLYVEPFTVVARRDAGIATFADLKDHRVNIGAPASAARQLMELAIEAEGWTRGDFSLADQLPATQQTLALCHDRVQAIVDIASAPDPAVSRVLKLCDATLVDIEAPLIDKLIASHPYLVATEIPGGTYPGVAEAVRTFGPTLTVIASADLDAEAAYRIVKAVFENLPQLKATFPAVGTLDARRMGRDGLSAPLHEGAMRYFKEQGLL